MKLIEQFTVDMTQLPGAAQPVLCRTQELRELITILCRRHKNNPALVGEPGVGKTALAYALGRLLAEGSVPVQLQGKRLLRLEMAGLIAGTRYRGEFEERVRDLLCELRRAQNVILFVDEMHTLVGAGAAEGAIDASNLLKPALSGGELQLLGATTSDEYSKYIEKDPALARRFCVLRVEEPGRDEAAQILRGLRRALEQHHRVRITDEAVEAAVDYSIRYLPDRFLPDKALDLLDESAALAVLGRACRVTGAVVAQTVAARTGIPAGSIEASERQRLRALAERLAQQVICQNQAVEAAAAAVRRGRLGLAEADRPVAALLLYGPTGVGKTALCKALAKEVYGSEHAMIRLDMTEYAEAHTAARLVGAPPGYVGHEDGGLLTEQVRRRPYSLVLFDELEKAHPDVLSLLLQIMEDGVLTDSRGRRADFRSTILVMTTNAGVGGGVAMAPGFCPAQAGDPRLRQYFSPEFLGRIDAVIPFAPLSVEALTQIAAQKLQQAAARAEAAGVRLRIGPDAAAALGRACADSGAGARGIRHLIQQQVESPLASLLLESSRLPVHAALEACGDRLTLRARSPVF